VTIWRMRITCCVPKATNAHSEYIIFIRFFTTKMFARTLLNVMFYGQTVSVVFYMCNGVHLRSEIAVNQHTRVTVLLKLS
jgi:hypothetical protein